MTKMEIYDLVLYWSDSKWLKDQFEHYDREFKLNFYHPGWTGWRFAQ